MKRVFGGMTMMLLLTVKVYGQVDSGYLDGIGHTPIYYESRGNGDPVLLIHGFIVNGESWKKTALYDSLLRSGYRVITMDLRGNGKSGKPHLADAYANDAEAKDIMLLADKFNLEQYTAVGYSRGSIITARLLVMDKRLRRAVMGGMGTDFTDPEWPRRKMFYRALSGDTVKELEPMVRYVQQSGLDQQALALLQKEQPSTPKAALAKVKQPVLVVCGKEDSDNGKASDLADLFSNGKYVTVPGDHGGAVRTPEFAVAVLDFLRK
ncbi:alpha/beta fold hydrolase [Flavihumibacter petaseus]|uniref:alpha/beta fold hydrolase n=1 Tax=Flavihumibacter petaseus TaxID=549295 RepID=UPI001FDF6F51|nr:alpha/beta fold hydrolase [Flavihumibacter petaseus]